MVSIKKIKVEKPLRHAIKIVTNGKNAKQIGAGAYATAYSSGDTVYKIGRYVENIAYLAYLRQVIKNSDPHFPVIKSATLFVDPHDSMEGAILVEMEKLQELPDSKSHELMVKINNIRHAVYGNDKNILPEAEPVAKVIKKAFKNAKRLDGTTVYDMHTGNFMMRGNQLVVTDPIA